MSRRWTAEQAERYLLSLELFGMRFGLDRMRRLMTALELPQRRFDAIHVVGTNGKSSTARMISAILERHGVRTGTYLSPHLVSFCERIRIRERDVDEPSFAAAVARAAAAAELVNRTRDDDDGVTQFEALTAAAYSELARRDVEVAVVEAGLGGRYDATNVLDSSVAVLTNVGLEHQRWLGPTVRDIAREKLAVVREGSTLVVGGLVQEAAEEARLTAAARGVGLVEAPNEPAVEVAALGRFQRRNFALATAAAEAYLGELDERALAEAAASVRVPGRLEVRGSDPLTLLDGAHNPDAFAALAEALDELHGDQPRRVVAVLSILEDKDAAAMLRVLLPRCAAAVFTSNPNPRALPPGTLESLAAQLGGPAAEVEPDPRRALERARALAGRSGIVIATGSIYLVAALTRSSPARRVSML